MSQARSDVTAIRSILIDGQRVRGVELGLSGKITNVWSVMAAFAYQDGEILTTQSAAVSQGAELGSLPKTTFSVWNRYDINQSWGVGLGVIIRVACVIGCAEEVLRGGGLG